MAADAKDKPCEACNGTGQVDAPTPYTRPTGLEKVPCEVCGGTGRVPVED
jgi:DnaJ-class molecular chaperone